VAARYLEKAADRHNPEAQGLFAAALWQGRGVACDRVRAGEYARPSAKSGDALGQLAYGLQLLDGAEIDQNVQKGMKYLRRSADQGNANAQWCSGVECLKESPPNVEEAVRYVKMAVDQRYAPAEAEFSILLADGRGVDRDPVQSAEYTRLSAKQGDADDQYLYGEKLLTRHGVEQNVNEGMEYLQRSADQGNAEAQCRYGMECLKQSPPNVEEAVRYVKMAVNQGDALARAEFSIFLADELGVDRDLVRSAEYARLSVKQGDADGQYLYGEKLLTGQGVEQNVNEGMKYLRPWADQGIADAQFTYGRQNVQRSQSCPPDTVRYLKMAADRGHSEAQRYSGRCLLLRFDVSADFSSVMHFYMKAAQQNDIASCIIVAAYFCSGRLDNSEFKVELEEKIEWLDRDLSAFNAESTAEWITEGEETILSGEGESDAVYATQELREKANCGHAKAQFLCGLFLRLHDEGLRFLR
jgi:TPR repeat protein